MTIAKECQKPDVSESAIFLAVLEISIILSLIVFAVEGVLNENGFQLAGIFVPQNLQLHSNPATATATQLMHLER